MVIPFIYDKSVDEACHERYADFLVRHNGAVWGRSGSIKQIFSIQEAVYRADLTEIVRAYEKAFSMKAPSIKGYLVTTPYSMIDDSGAFSANESSIFYSIYSFPPSIVLGHEIFHVFFEKHTKREIPNYEEAKEYFTVIMNDIFQADVSKGYPEHQDIRKKIFDIWMSTKSIDECIKVIK